MEKTGVTFLVLKKTNRATQAKKMSVYAMFLLLLSSCDKGGGSFSVLSDSSSFQQSVTFTPRKIDVLFVIDNSGSMQTSQNNLAQNFPSFINKFISRGYDFRIAVTTSDAYYGDQFVTQNCTLCTEEQTRFKSGSSPKVYVIDKNDFDLTQPSEAQRLRDLFTLNAKVGITGSGDERAFSSFKAALTSDLNVNFHRSDAFLAVVILSDEEDFSHTSISMNENYNNTGLFSVQSYVDFLSGFTGGLPSQDFSVSTISILDETCRSTLAQGSGSQKIGQRYIQLSQATGGTQNSLCSSFDNSLDNISSQILTQSRPVYILDRVPLVASITVSVNGINVPQSETEGWSYNSADNSISINGSAYRPNAGSQILINFDPDLTAN